MLKTKEIGTKIKTIKMVGNHKGEEEIEIRIPSKIVSRHGFST